MLCTVASNLTISHIPYETGTLHSDLFTAKIIVSMQGYIFVFGSFVVHFYVKFTFVCGRASSLLYFWLTSLSNFDFSSVTSVEFAYPDRRRASLLSSLLLNCHLIQWISFTASNPFSYYYWKSNSNWRYMQLVRSFCQAPAIKLMVCKSVLHYLVVTIIAARNRKQRGSSTVLSFAETRSRSRSRSMLVSTKKNRTECLNYQCSL